MRVEGIMILHYGCDYVRYALLSVLDHVDRAHVVYCPHPSHGTPGAVPPIESRDQLRAQVMDLPKVAWHDVSYRNEGPHRDHALSLCKGDLALVVDADEVWDGDVLDACLRRAYDGGAREWLVNFTTLWRSFDWRCTDGMWPIRIHDLRREGGTEYLREGPVWHFGYAVTDRVMRYKMAIHGHRAEWRRGWYATKWRAWPPEGDCHPTCERTWYPERYDKGVLPRLMWSHPFYNVEVIR